MSTATPARTLPEFYQGATPIAFCARDMCTYPEVTRSMSDEAFDELDPCCRRCGHTPSETRVHYPPGDGAEPWLWSRCALDRMIVLAVIMSPKAAGERPCDECNHDRSRCGGFPRKDGR